MLVAKTIIDQIEIKSDGTLQVRFAKRVYADDTVIGEQYHRISVVPGVAIIGLLDAVDKHLADMGFPNIEDRSMILDAVSTFHTPQRVTAYKAAEQARALIRN